MTTTWPPTLAQLKTDLLIEQSDTRNDDRLQMDLDAAVSFVQRQRPVFRYDPTDPDQISLPDVTADHVLGTLRLAGRFGARRRSPEGIIIMQELGSARVSSGDPDIDRLLRIGRYTPMTDSFA